MPLFINKYEFRELFGFNKTNGDFIFGNLAKFKNYWEEQYSQGEGGFKFFNLLKTTRGGDKSKKKKVV